MTTAPDPLLLRERARELLNRREELANRWECGRLDCDGLPHEGWAHKHARGTQHEPDEYDVWAIITGRGWGKTRTGSETAKKWTRKRRRHIAVIGKTDRETRNICFEGPSGLLKVIRPELRADYTRSAGDTTLTLTNGSIYRGFSAERPESIRGYAFDGAWCDEYAAWPIQFAADAWDNLWFALREAADPHVVVTTTPRPRQHVKDLLADAAVITKGHSKENQANLSAKAMRALERRYGGTRLGRQELGGELLDDVEGALWTWGLIEDNRVEEAPEDIWRIVIAVDPATTSADSSDETGIIVVGIAGDRAWPHLYVLDDLSGRYSPDGWATVVDRLYRHHLADAVVAEVNQGGDMVEAVLRQHARDIRYRGVHATRGKHLRAEPIVALYEQGRMHHVGVYPQLEDQQTTWTPDSKDSPDRLDALVWGGTDLLRLGPASVSSPVNLRVVRGGQQYDPAVG